MRRPYVELNLPPIHTMVGGKTVLKQRDSIRVGPAGKPPKRRFRPGQKAIYQNTTYTIVYMYRVKDDPQEWVYVLEEIRPEDEISYIAGAMGLGKETPRVVYEVFRDTQQVYQFFVDIPANGDRVHLKNGRMLREVKVVT